MRRLLCALAASAMVFSVTHSADAQGGRAELRQATSEFRSALEVRGRRGSLYHAAQRLERVAHQRGRRGQLRQAYRSARRILMRARGVDDQLLDQWDVVVRAVRFRRGRPPIAQPPQPPIVQPIAHPQYTFEGRIETLPVRFAASSIEGIESQCRTFLRGANANYVDDIEIGGVRHHNRHAYWRTDAICAIVAINSGPAGAAATVVGNVEGTPFCLAETPARARQILTRYLPRALANTGYIDDFELQGQRYRNQRGYWSAQDVAHMIGAQLPGNTNHVRNVRVRLRGAS
ncbi:MAG: hypothetical protein AAGE52_04285 [Myxococcota bacterium]